MTDTGVSNKKIHFLLTLKIVDIRSLTTMAIACNINSKLKISIREAIYL